MKVIFILTSGTIVYWMKWRKPYCATYDEQLDSFQVVYLIIPTALLSLIWHIAWTPFEVLWAFSIFLESVAILPQLHMLQCYAKEQNGSIENLTGHYIFALGCYRAFYVINWIERLIEQKHWGDYWDPIAWVAGIVQTAIYLDFFYYYLMAIKMGKSLALPV